MKFDELKPGMLLISTTMPITWTVIKHKFGDSVTTDDYWRGTSGRFYRSIKTAMHGHFYKEHSGGIKRSYHGWKEYYRLATTKDAQELIVELFAKDRTIIE